MTSTSHANERGGARERRRRREWLMAEYGNGGVALCWLCGVPLLLEDITVDRVIPGIEGGTYARFNIRPACLPDNLRRGGELGAMRRSAKRGTNRGDASGFSAVALTQ